MIIKELNISMNGAEAPELSWVLSEGEQASFDLFLIQGGTIVERVRLSTAVTRCSLRTMIEPMREYAVLLTVKSDRQLSSARAGFFAAADKPMTQCVSYEGH